jgi:hypothetical protein
MNIRLDRLLCAAGVSLPPGEYEVSVDESSHRVLLSELGRVLRIPGVRRSSKMRVDEPSVQLRQVVGEPRSLLIVRVPPATEWVVSLQAGVRSGEEEGANLAP